MTTLEHLQRLSDGKFHRLCDDLLRRLEPRYARLRTHGLNDDDESIGGQPDSYVGDSAATCRIAFCYTVQKRSWWTKLVADVQAAVAASPNVEEVVAAVPWDVDRDGPTKGDNIDWIAQARATAGKATFATCHGPEIARLLDTDHQDLRHGHLGIPYSHLSYAAILASCQAANAAAIEELGLHGRYDSGRYLFREADREMFRVWQRAWRDDKEAVHKEPVRLVALVNGAGLGKTSLLCSFVESLSPCLPVLLLQARNLSFDAEDCLVRAVVQSLQGVLSPGLVREEEAAVAHHLAKHARLTVVLDGLDESGSPTAVRRAIRFWLHSLLGRHALLVVSSRREFWAACGDRAWGRWMPSPGRQEDRGAAAPDELGVREADPSEGLRLPGLFSPEELERAWDRAGQSANALQALLPEVREELRHPFTLRAYTDLAGRADTASLRTRTDIMAAWLENRLQAEEDREGRLTADVYRATLRAVARKIKEAEGGWVDIQRLDDVPWFTTASPPGRAVQRLLQAGILESLPGHPDRIRFVFEAVQDFFLGEDDADLVERDPSLAAWQSAKGTYSRAYIRLDRLARRIVGADRRGEFLAALAGLDSLRAAVVLRACPEAYEPALREKIVGRLQQDVASRRRVKGGFAVGMLGRLDCPESRRALLAALPPLETCPTHLRLTGAWALARLGCVEGVPFVYAYPWFWLPSGDGAYYFQDLLELLRGARPDFKSALSSHAMQFLVADSGRPEHGRAVCVLAYLGDDRLVANLEGRLEANGALQEYENHALLALGTEAAARLFVASARQAAVAMKQLGYGNNGLPRLEVHLSISPKSADIRYLITPAFVAALETLITNASTEVLEIGMSLAGSSLSPRLVHRSLQVRAERGMGPPAERRDDAVDPRTWLSWWEAADCDQLRRVLLGAIGPTPSVEIEQVLIECLDNPSLRTPAAHLLGQMGGYRAADSLRRLLEEGLAGWDALEVVLAVGRLGDPRAVGILVPLARSGLLDLVVVSLGLIGAEDAERALATLLAEGAEARWVVGGLFLHGSGSAVARIVKEARQGGRGPLWLAESLRRAFFWLGHVVGRYYTHIPDGELIDYLEANEQVFQGKEKWNLIHAVEQIDSKNVRRLLRLLASRKGMPEDAVVRENDGLCASTLAYHELLYRGDTSAVSPFVGEAVSLDPRRTWVARELARFPQEQVSSHLGLALSRASGDEERATIVRLLGFVGSKEDAEQILGFVDSGDDNLANAAYEAHCRLTDPLLVPPNWSSL
jgi:hypothetical protein